MLESESKCGLSHLPAGFCIPAGSHGVAVVSLERLELFAWEFTFIDV